MPKSKNKINQELNKIEQDRVDAEKQRLIEAYRQQMMESRQLKAQEHYDTPAAEAWHELSERLKHDRGVEGYDSFLSQMLQMLAMQEILGRALAYSLMQKVNQFVMAISAYLDGRKTYEDLKDQLGPITPAQKRGFIVEMNEKGELTYHAVDSTPLPDPVKQNIRDIVEAWLNERSYTLNDENKVFLEADRYIDAGAFCALRDHDTSGLRAFMNGELSKYFDYGPRTSP